MMNQMLVIGRLVDNPKVEKTEQGKRVMNMTLAVPRTYKNSEGIYDTDFVDCVLWEGIAENTAEYCKKGDLVGIRGRVQTDLYEKDGQKHKSTRIIAERVSFLSSRSRGDEEEKTTSSKTKSKGMEK